MAFSCGFYNSINHDRVYDSVQFGEMFDGLITDGVYATVGNCMNVSVVSGMTVRVRSGRAWFNKTWSVNTTDYPLEIPPADVLLPRIDAVVLEVDVRTQTRNNSLKIISGRSASNPVKPTLIRENGLYQYPLAWVTVPANARSLTNGNIEIQVGRSPTPYVTGVVSSVDITSLYNQWEQEFQNWFDDIRDGLQSGGDNILTLISRISALESKVASLPSEATRDEMNELKVNQKYISPNVFGNWWRSTNAVGTIQDILNFLSNPTGKYISPATLGLWWVQTSESTYGGGPQATTKDILSGEKYDVYISPAHLKQAFPNLYNGSVGSGSGSTGGGELKTGNGTIIYSSNVQKPLNTNYQDRIQYYQYGNIVILSIGIGFNVTANRDSIGFTIRGIPTPLTTILYQQSVVINRKSAGTNVGASYDGLFGRLLGSSESNSGMYFNLEGFQQSSSSDSSFKPAYDYYISEQIVYCTNDI